MAESKNARKEMTNDVDSKGIERQKEGQQGASRSGIADAGKEQRGVDQEALNQISGQADVLGERQEEGLASVSDGERQGIANRSAEEENKRQSKVVPFRKDNEVRNTEVKRPKAGNE